MKLELMKLVLTKSTTYWKIDSLNVKGVKIPKKEFTKLSKLCIKLKETGDLNVAELWQHRDLWFSKN